MQRGAKAQIGEIAANWLVAHPEYLVAASDSLRQQQQAAQQQVLQTLALQKMRRHCLKTACRRWGRGTHALPW
ncbi:hypothetical protein [Klebsiella michiganensis]|uniref:hypothetical protein n=1 Tax=Klebsiella michiganensis TaxID=1134687 RepID=UPI0032EC11A1